MDEIPSAVQSSKALWHKVIAIYCRISQDDEERGEGVENQKKWGRAYAEKTWPGVPVEVFCDNDLSAADPTVVRPEFQRLREWINTGRVAQIWASEQFRLCRMPEEWFPWARELTTAGLDVIHTKRHGIVIVNSEAAGINVVIGGGEVNRTKSRVEDTLEENALKGKPPGSRPAGYRHARVRGVDTYEVVEEEWRPRLWAAKAILDGAAVDACTEELRRQGVPGSHHRYIRDENGKTVIDPETGEPAFRATQIESGVLRRWMLSPTVAGLRVHKGQIVGRGNWPPLLCDDPWSDDAYDQALAMRNRLLEHFGKPREVVTRSGSTYPVTSHALNKKGRTRRKYLMTGGKLVCAKCQHPIIGGLKGIGKGDRAVKKPYYYCTTRFGGGGCVGMLADELNRIIKERLLAHIATKEFAATWGADPHQARRETVIAELNGLSVKRQALADAWANDELGDVEWKAARTKLDEREAAARGELAGIPDPPPQEFDPKVLRDPRVWDGMTLSERRHVVDLVVESVVLKKAKPPYSKVDPSRVVITWR